MNTENLITSPISSLSNLNHKNIKSLENIKIKEKPSPLRGPTNPSINPYSSLRNFAFSSKESTSATLSNQTVIQSLSPVKSSNSSILNKKTLSIISSSNKLPKIDQGSFLPKSPTSSEASHKQQEISAIQLHEEASQMKEDEKLVTLELQLRNSGKPGPHFLAPTAAKLQYLKENKFKREVSEKGFTFAKPKEVISKYEHLQTIEEGREAIKIEQTHHTSKSPRGVKHDKVIGFGLNNTTKYKSNPYDFHQVQSRHNHENSELKKGIKRKPSSIMTKELQTRWGIVESASGSEDEEDPERRSKSILDNSVKERNVCFSEKPRKTKHLEQKEVLSARLKAERKIKKKINETKEKTNSKQSFSWNTKGKIFLKNHLLKIEATQKPKDGNENEIEDKDKHEYENELLKPDNSILDVLNETQTGENIEERKKNVFLENSVDFFRFNEDNKLFSAFGDLFTTEKKANLLLEKREDKRLTRPILVSLGPSERIIQPLFMQNTGSMCVTEFWPKKNSNVLYHRLKDGVNHVQVKKEERRYESIYRPQQWRKEEKIKEKLTDLSGLGSVRQIIPSKSPERLEHPYTWKDSPKSSQKTTNTSYWRDNIYGGTPSIVERLITAENNNSRIMKNTPKRKSANRESLYGSEFGSNLDRKERRDFSEDSIVTRNTEIWSPFRPEPNLISKFGRLTKLEEPNTSNFRKNNQFSK